MRIGYNTNGLAHHSLSAAIKLLAGIGYRSVAITIDQAVLNPYGKDLAAAIRETRAMLTEYNMTSVIETGARFLLDPIHKHAPTLLAEKPIDRERRIGFLKHAIDIAAALESDCVSLWSGSLPASVQAEEGLSQLAEGLRSVLEHAAERNVVIGFEPEPGMLVDTMARCQELLSLVDSPLLKLTLDVGHLHCQGETPISEVIRHWHKRLVNVHIEDMRVGVHEHLMFGEGEIDFPPVIAALADVGYAGPLNVELSRHSHVGSVAARQAFEFLNPLL